MTMSMTVGSTGAKRQTWRTGNPREILKSLIDRHPSLSEEDLFDLFWEEIKEHEKILLTIAEYWHTNNYRSLMLRNSGVDSQTRKAEIAAAQTKIVERIKQEAKIVLLDMLLPNGKALRDCTGRECVRLGAKVGGWLSKIAKHIKPDETVGAKLSEAQVRKLYGR